MKSLVLLRTSAHQALANKISWLYIFVVLAGQITAPSSPFSMATPSIKSVSSEIWFLSTVLSLILSSALVYSVSQKELNNLVSSVPDSLHKGWSKLIQVGLLNILFLVALFVLLASVSLLFKKLISYGILRTFILAPFLRPILYFGVCAIIISNNSVVASLRISVLMFARNILQTLIISSILILVQHVLLDILVLIFLNEYAYLLFSSPLELLELPQVMFWDQVLALVISPWIITAFTHLYLSFMNAFASTVLSTSQEAA